MGNTWKYKIFLSLNKLHEVNITTYMKYLLNISVLDTLDLSTINSIK